MFPFLSAYAKSFFVFFLIAVFSQTSFGQIAVKEESRTMSEGLQPAFIVVIPEAEIRNVQQNWTRTMRREYKGRVRSSGGETVATRVVFVALGLGDIQIFARMSEQSKELELVAWFKSDNAFISSETNLTAANEVKRFMQRFAHEQFLERRADALAEQEKKYEDQQKSLTRLQREKQRLEGNIAKWEQQITEARQRIYQNEKEQEELDRQIKDQLEHVERQRQLLNEARSQ